MEEKLVDVRGEVCPKPLILTKKALKECSDEQPLRILIDNATSKDNVVRFLCDNGYAPECSETNGTFTLVFSKRGAVLPQPDAEAYCSVSSPKPHVIVVKSRYMGHGDEELGELLLKAFINTIKEISPLPQTIVFYNGGIVMTIDDSPVLPALRELERQGVALLICGTCAEFFKMKEQIHIGTISNMYTILETLTGAGKVIEP